MKFFQKSIIAVSLMGFALFGLVACDSLPTPKPNYPDELAERYEQTGGSILGSQGIKLFDDKANEQNSGGGMNVNAYLWRATLDTLSFMPLAQVDPFGGVIITDWHSNTDNKNERLKVNAYILGQELRANGLRVSVFKQVKAQDENNQITWVSADVADDVNSQLEDAILTRARQMRIASKAPSK